jgi:hypothetical protein
MLYGGRISYDYPYHYPLGRLSGEELLKRADSCRYFLFIRLGVAGAQLLVPAMYPYDLIGDSLGPVFVSDQTIRGKRTTAAALGERRGGTEATGKRRNQ